MGVECRAAKNGGEARNLPLVGRSEPDFSRFREGGCSATLGAMRRGSRYTRRRGRASPRLSRIYDRIALRFEPSRPRGIGVTAEGVLLAIDLDDELRGRAEEVDDVPPDGMLTAEREPAQAPIAQLAPELELSVRHIAAHALRERSDARRQISTRQYPLPKLGSQCSPTFDLPSRGRLSRLCAFDRALVPNPKSPIPNPQSPIPT